MGQMNLFQPDPPAQSEQTQDNMTTEQNDISSNEMWEQLGGWDTRATLRPSVKASIDKPSSDGNWQETDFVSEEQLADAVVEDGELSDEDDSELSEEEIPETEIEPPVGPPVLAQSELEEATTPVNENKESLTQGFLIAPEQLTQTKGKTLEALAYSRQKRDDLVRLFRNLVPQSIMLADKATRDAADLASGSYEASGQLAKKRAKGEIVNPGTTAFEVSGRGGAAGALSKFPQNIGRSMLLLYSNELDTVVDPFAGHNSRMEFCVRERRHYWGQDLSHNFCEFNRERAKVLQKTFPEITIKLFEGNSQIFQVPDTIGDFTITSPPYWDIEYYGDEVNQLGLAKTYQEFIDGLAIVAKENYRALKPGAFAVWYINDFRKGGKFYPYHIDTMHIMNAAGFVTWDITITDFGRTFRSAFVNQIVEQKILPKKHEYGWVFRKPGWAKK